MTSHSARNHETGFVYVFTNPDFHDRVKIGMTQRLPEDRARELPAPSPFEIAFRQHVSFPKKVEAGAHAELAAKRTPRGEFFRCSVSEAVNAVWKAARRYSGVSAWRAEIPNRIVGSSLIVVPTPYNTLIAFLTTPHFLSDQWEVFDVWLSHSNQDWIEIFGADNEANVVAPDILDSDFATKDVAPHLNRSKSVFNSAIIGKEFLTPGDRIVIVETSPCGATISACFEAYDWAQVIGRTKSLTPSGFVHLPLHMNETNRDYPTNALDSVSSWISATGPRNWAPRGYFPGFGERVFGTIEKNPVEWMPHLAKSPRARKRQNQ